jgi:uncharacterized membrane protein YwzB
MKKSILFITCFIIISLIISWAMVGFVCFDFNPKYWSDGQRFIMIFISLVISYIISGIYFLGND